MLEHRLLRLFTPDLIVAEAIKRPMQCADTFRYRRGNRASEVYESFYVQLLPQA